MNKEEVKIDCLNCPAFGMHCPHRVNGDPYYYNCTLTVAVLEKENAELKIRNQELLESCEGATMMYKDLQKAKEILKKYLSIGVGGKITQNYLDVTKEAEQFLKEVEK